MVFAYDDATVDYDMARVSFEGDIVADTLDLLSLSEAKTAINLSGSGHDTQLAQFITAVSRRIDDLCGPVVVREVTSEAYDGGCSTIWLRSTPVDTVGTVVEYRGTSGTTLTAATVTNQPSSAYLLDVRGHYAALRRRSGNGDSTFASGRRNIVVTYDAGRYANTAAVDAKFKMAAGSILRRLWNREAGAWARGGNPFEEAGVGTVGFFKAIDPMVQELLADELTTRRAGGPMVA